MPFVDCCATSGDQDRDEGGIGRRLGELIDLSQVAGPGLLYLIHTLTQSQTCNRAPTHLRLDITLDLMNDEFSWSMPIPNNLRIV